MDYKYRTNWVDGMKINKGHFIDSENAMIQQMIGMNGNYVHQNNYGLLPSVTNENAVKLSISIDGTDSLKVTVHKCYAVTLGGFQIGINDTISEGLEVSELKSIGGNIKIGYVLLCVKAFDRVSLGLVNPEEEPQRKPYVSQKYSISLVSEDELNTDDIGVNSVILGKFLKEGVYVNLVDGYIPPCTSIQSHINLKHAYAEIEVLFNNMESYCFHIILKIQQKKQSNELSKMVCSIAKDVLLYLRGTIANYRNLDKNAPPIEMITKVMSLARIIKGGIDFSIGTGKDDLLNYLTDWCDMNQGTFEKELEGMVNLEYKHTDISKAIERVSMFTRLINGLFQKLSELEYIGKKLDSSIFVKEDVIIEEPVKKRRRFFME